MEFSYVFGKKHFHITNLIMYFWYAFGANSYVCGIRKEILIELEFQCQKRGLDDYVQIGGSTGLDNTYLQVVDSICGLDSKAGMYKTNGEWLNKFIIVIVKQLTVLSWNGGLLE